MEGTTVRVVIGMDPHKRSVTIEVMTKDESIVGTIRFVADAHLGGPGRRELARAQAQRGWFAREGVDDVGAGLPIHRRPGHAVVQGQKRALLDEGGGGEFHGGHKKSFRDGRNGTPVFVNCLYCRNYGLAGPNSVFWPFLRGGLPGHPPNHNKKRSTQ